MESVRNEIELLLIEELSKHYHFDLNDPSILLAKNPGTGNPITTIASKFSIGIQKLIEKTVEKKIVSAFDDYGFYD